MHRTTFVPRSNCRSIWQAMLLALLTSLASTRGGVVHAQDPMTPLVTIPGGEFRQVQMSKKQNIREARSENPKIVRLFADPEKPNVITVKGESPGTTKVFLTDETKAVEVFDVRVTTPGEKSPDEKRKEFLELVSRVYPSASVHVLYGPNDTFVVHGDSGGESNASGVTPREGITELAYRVFGRTNVVVNFNRAGVQQVQLEVVVAVVNRTEARNIAFSFIRQGKDSFLSSVLQAPLSLTGAIAPGVAASAASLSGSPNLIFGVTTNNASFTGYLQALRTEGLAKVMSEPRIVTLSGKSAYINSGGEVPTFATSGLGQATINYKSFGTTVEFLPIILSGDRIYLEVRPEISDIDESLRVTLGQNTAPGFRTRKAQVAVQMEDGQTLAIGGLIQNSVNASTTKVPILGDLPWVGAAFRNTTYLEKEEELIILVTPRLVDPIPCTSLPKYLPGRETRSPDDYELFLEGILEAPRGQRTICVGNGGRWTAAHTQGPSAGLYPCNDGSSSHLSRHLQGGSCATGACGVNGPCRSGLCPSGACGNSGGVSGGTGRVPASTPYVPTRNPIRTSGYVHENGTSGIVVETLVEPEGRIVPAQASEYVPATAPARLPSAPNVPTTELPAPSLPTAGLPSPLLEDPR